VLFPPPLGPEIRTSRVRESRPKIAGSSVTSGARPLARHATPNAAQARSTREPGRAMPFITTVITPLLGWGSAA
jgi:hypothetical protein